MPRSAYPYTRNFMLSYLAGALAVTVVIYVIFVLLRWQVQSPILRGALIGGAVGAMLVPFQYFARAFLAHEKRRPTGAEAWRFSLIWAICGLAVHVVMAVALFALGWQVPGLLPQEQGQLVGLLLGVAFVVQVPVFRLFLWSALKGAETRLARSSGG
ncbi:ABZJ_00895 family protein [Nioella nitratireducens]|uniref:ABZJ_00895 family protein n=1 Tax=Nioella nitratireducens TaxID=1287720 RepID=UPI0008FD618E|nr:ABZJ_00895 family protein [Nioella nitratireducens]